MIFNKELIPFYPLIFLTQSILIAFIKDQAAKIEDIT